MYDQKVLINITPIYLEIELGKSIMSWEGIMIMRMFLFVK